MMSREVGHHADSEGLFSVDQGLSGVFGGPVDGAVVLVVDDGSDLEEVEDLLASGCDVHVDGELHLDGAAHLLGAHAEDVRNDLGEGGRCCT